MKMNLTKRTITMYRSHLLLSLLLSLLLDRAHAQIPTFAETFRPDGNKNAAGSIPNFRIAGVASLSEIVDSADHGASANVTAEFNLWDRKERPNMFNLALNYNIGAEIRTDARDSVKLSDIFFPDRSRSAFGVGLSSDLLRWVSKNKVLDNVHTNKNGKDNHSYFRVMPAVEYSYSRWNLRSVVILPDEQGGTDTVLTTDRIQTSQWIYGVKCWYTLLTGDNTIGVLFYPFWRSTVITDGTYPEYKALFGQYAGSEGMPQKLDFLNMMIAMQVNKVLFSFTYSELIKDDAITDRNVSGGVFLLKISTSADFIDL